MSSAISVNYCISSRTVACSLRLFVASGERVGAFDLHSRVGEADERK